MGVSLSCLLCTYPPLNYKDAPIFSKQFWLTPFANVVTLIGQQWVVLIISLQRLLLIYVEST